MDLIDHNSEAYKEGWRAWDVYYDSNWKIKIKNLYNYELEHINYLNFRRGWNDNIKGIK